MEYQDLPWFDLYNEPEPAKDLGAGFDRIRSVKDIDEQDNVEWKDVNAADVRKCSKCGNEKIQGNDDEALFDERWKDGKEGRIVDIDASAPSRILFNTKLPFVHINKPKPQHRKCRCAPGPANTSAGKSEWTYELDNVSPLTK